MKKFEIVEIEKEIGNKVKSKLIRANREYFLREQIKAIQDELGEDEESKEINKYNAAIKKA